MAQPDRGPDRTSLADATAAAQRDRYSDDEFHAIEEIAIAVVEQFFPEAETNIDEIEEISEEQAERGLKDMSDAAKRVAPKDPDRRRLLMSEGAALGFAYYSDQMIDEIDQQLQFAMTL